MLIGVILAHAGLIATARGFAPLLLLDEPAVHLDAARRRALWEVLASLPAQTIVTGTDADIFLPLTQHAEAFATGGGGLHPDRRFLHPEIAASLSRPSGRCYISRVTIPLHGDRPRHV